MTKPLLVYIGWRNRNGQTCIEHGKCYFGEQAEIMRLAYGIPDNLEVVVCYAR